MLLYEARKLNKSFNGNSVIKNFSLKIESGEFIGIAGKRGKGMTTLIHMLTGILKPDSGEILYKNKKASKFRLNSLRKHKIAYIPTEPLLMSEMDIYDNMLIAVSHKPGSDRNKKKKARDVLKILGLKGKGRFYPRELSLLERQKVCIARAVLKEPDIIFCDEPADVLEGYEAEELMEVFEVLNEAGYTIVITTHSKRVASRCHRVVPIGSGVVLDGIKSRSGDDEKAGDVKEAEAEEETEAEETAEEMPDGEEAADEETVAEETAEETVAEETAEEECEETAEEENEEAANEDSDAELDNAIAAAAFEALGGSDKEEKKEEKFSYEDYKYTEEADDTDDSGEEEEDEDEAEEEAEDDINDQDIDMWEQLINRKKKPQASDAPEDILPELDLKDIFKNQ